MFEARKILEAARPRDQRAVLARVAVAVGHYENVWVTCVQPVDLWTGAALDVLLLGQAKFVKLLSGAAGEGPQRRGVRARARPRAGGQAARRPARPQPQELLPHPVAGDNLRVGAATNAIRIASRWFPARGTRI